MLCLAAVGCAGNVPNAVDARGAGEWTFRLPETRSPYAALAAGRSGPSAPVSDAALELPELAPAAVASTAPVARPKPSAKAQPRVLARASEKQVEPQAPPAAPATAPQIEIVEPQLLAASAPPAATSKPGESERYAGREAQAQKQRDYRGGDAIVISASALVVILLVVILVLLLT